MFGNFGYSFRVDNCVFIVGFDVCEERDDKECLFRIVEIVDKKVFVDMLLF